MGTKTPHKGYEEQDENLPASRKSINTGGEPRGEHMARDGDGCLGDGESSDDDHQKDSNLDMRDLSLSSNVVSTKKKRKKPRTRKSKKKFLQQTSPPTIPLSMMYLSGKYPEGEVHSYNPPGERIARTTKAEERYDDRVHWKDDTFLNNFRKAAEVHRQVRQWVQDSVRPGQTTENVVSTVEDSVRALLGNAGLEAGESRISGLGFPTGLCLNHQVAHYTPNPGQKKVVLQQDDVMTLDFGVHIDGWIVDSAFTMAFSHTYDNLLAAVRDATNSGIETAGVDVRISDVSAAIQETMESYEVEIRGKTFPVKPIRNITGHNIKQFRIHGGKSVPFVKNSDQTKMEEGEVFAIETFGTTGRGYTVDDVGTYGYRLRHDAPLNVPIFLSSAKRLHKTIRENFGTLVFCRRYLDRLGVDKYLAAMNSLVSNNIVDEYCPLTDVRGSYSAQFEHTILLTETHKEIFSRGNDY